MLDLNRHERLVLVSLLSLLLIGLSIAAYQRCHSPAEVRIGRFDPEEAALFSARRVNINSAGPGELESLAGVGSAIAGRIIEYRESHGAFASIEEIKKVKGVGQSLFDKIKDRITVEE